MLKQAVAAFAVAALIFTSGVAAGHTVPVRHHTRYCCAPKSNPYALHRVVHKRSHHHVRIHKLAVSRILNRAFLTRFSKLGEFRLTAYTGDDPVQGTGHYTSSGDVVRYGLVAVPRWIPLGTYLYIPGYGIARAADHGSAVNGMHIDLCFGSGSAGSNAMRMARSWGTKYNVPVYQIPARLISLFR